MFKLRHISFGILFLTVLALFLVACAGGGETPAPTSTPVPPQATEPSTPDVIGDDSWESIQSAGKIVVGTSADYPPFESYNADFLIDGFDIALMNAIVEELGIDLEVVDIAFDGLADALRVGQIDAAIAAIAVSPEREEAFDFSHIYWISEDAYVASADASIDEIRSVADLANYRVGVQRASVFQNWLEDELIDTELMPSYNLYVYADIELAIPDLEAGRVDLLIMDKPVADVLETTTDLVVVARGLNRERYAIAVPNGQNTLRTRLNQALITLANEGVIVDLAGTYLNVDPDEIIPLPTPSPEPEQPEPTPIPPTACQDGMKWVADLNYPDNNMKNPPVLQPGEAFQKGWRIRNTGTCTWTSEYVLNFVQGNRPGARMGGQPTAIQGQVPPGGEYDMYINLVAPLEPAVYQGFWQLSNAQKRPFGQRIYVGITVPASATPTPVPTQTPSADINFWTDRTNIRNGECTTNHWRTQSVREVYYYQEGQNWQNHGVAGTGDRQECPHQTTTYYLRVVKRDNNVETRQLTVHVEENVNAPNIRYFNSDPPGQIAVGQCINLTWEVTGNVNRVKLSRNNTTLWDGAPFRGSTKDCPPEGDMTYRLDATGPGGSSSATQHARVVAGQATATPAPGPIIYDFTVSPNQIETGQCVDLAWSTGGGTRSVRIFRNDNLVQDNAGLQGSLQDCLNQTGRFTYRLAAGGANGQTVTKEASVTVGAPQPTATPVPPQAPVINSFTASPNQIDAGQCVNLAWSFTGQDLATSNITRNGQEIARDMARDGSQQDCPPGDGMVTYTLKVDAEFGGSAQQSAQVQVASVQVPTPTTPPAQPPTIQYFAITSDGTTIISETDLGQCVFLTWNFSGDSLAATSLSRNGQVIYSDFTAGDSYRDCLTDPALVGTLNYRLKVDSEFGGSATRDATLTVIGG